MHIFKVSIFLIISFLVIFLSAVHHKVEIKKPFILDILNGLYTSFMIEKAFLLDAPITTLSGHKKSLTAAPSLKNSGFET